MTITVGINGFGRIGRNFYRALVAAGVAADRIDLVKPISTNGGGDLKEARRVEVSVK